MTLSVIGAGFGRTGTESMKQALEMLGFGPCYHMLEVLPDKDRVETWRQAAVGNLPNWDEAFAGFRATVDWPGARYWRELSAHYPEAKILLTVRDSESWYRSMDNTILKVLRNRSDPDSIASKLLFEDVFKGNVEDRDHVIAIYEKNITEVQETFGEDRLLTYTLGDGWGPLCKFLDCAVPEAAYPHKNKPDDFDKSLERAESMRNAD